MPVDQRSHLIRRKFSQAAERRRKQLVDLRADHLRQHRACTFRADRHCDGRAIDQRRRVKVAIVWLIDGVGGNFRGTCSVNDGAILRGVWVEEKNIADPAVLQSMLEASGLPARRVDDSQSQAVHERYEQDSQRAIDSGVFGASTYVAHGEMFWGQDRLDFLERRLARG